MWPRNYFKNFIIINRIGISDIDIRVSMTEYNFIYWTIPVKIKVSCNFVDDNSCVHEYLPELDPEYSRIELCSDDDSSFVLDFTIPA